MTTPNTRSAAYSTMCCCIRPSWGWKRKKQLASQGLKPDYLVGCVGGGSNFAGLVLPFLRRKLAGENIRFVASEPRACPTLTRGAVSLRLR